jgi:diaminohydroxyphosphoribosylaminopyrimidine deaminase / 5-amino-6-(5-phosphoribosylamino)uracil reductase
MPPFSELDEQFMRRAIRLAMNGRGRVEPNPMVGCVIVKDRRVIGEGYHQQFGGPHAEPNALASCTESPAGATAYVTLEPCCHLNKKTPPCAPRVIEAGIARVVIGCLDPNPDVDGKGVAMLREAGVQVDGPVLEGEAKQLIAPFIARTRLGRPYVTLKWAQTADGKVAGPGGARMQISNERSMRLVHELRARSDAIMVGIRTVLIDDPMLTARDVEGARPLMRVVIDPVLHTPPNSRLLATAKEGPVLILNVVDRCFHVEAMTLMDAGAELVRIETEPGSLRLKIPAILAELGRRGVTHLMVEAGPRLGKSFLTAHAADRIWVFRSPTALDDAEAPNAWQVRYPPAGSIDLDGDTLTEYFNPRSDVFFANTPSADFVLAQR